MCCLQECSLCLVQYCSDPAPGPIKTAGNANGAPSSSEGQFEGIAAANALPGSAGLMGAADPMAVVQALQALSKVSGCYM